MTQQVKKVISSQIEDDLLQARKSLSRQIDRSLQKRSSKAEEVKKTSLGNRDNLLILPPRHMKTKPDPLPQMTPLPSLRKLRKPRRPKATTFHRPLRRFPGVLLQMCLRLGWPTNPTWRPLAQLAQQQIIQSAS